MNTLKPVALPSGLGKSALKVVSAAFQASVKALDTLTDSFIPSVRLFCGSVKNSYISGVRSLPTMAEFLSRLKEEDITQIVEHPNGGGSVLVTALIPKSYRGFTGMVRLSELTPNEARRVIIHHRKQYKIGQTVTKTTLYLEDMLPVSTDAVTFILSADFMMLQEWFPGNDPALTPPSDNLGSHMVLLCAPPVEAQHTVVRRVFT